MAMLKRRGFLQPAYELYGGLAGFFEYGPLGAPLKRNLEEAWRRLYVLGEGFAEIQAPTISPEPVFRASGHLASFQDPLVECGQCGASLRADKLLEEHVARAPLAKQQPAVRAQVERLLGPGEEHNWGTLKLGQFDEVLRALAVPCPECGQRAWGTAHHFNLMFQAPVGPGARAKGAYLRPETAQGMFTTFPWTYRYFREKLPFGVVQLGKAYRNEIAPRQGLLRLREFHQMEAEVFVHPERKGHARFASIAGEELPLAPAAGRTKEEAKAGQALRMPVGEAVRKGIVGSEALGYYLWLTYSYLTSVGLPPERLRFRQHAREEMAHYSADTWDGEFLSGRFGWVELVGIADRTDYDLGAHSRVSGQRLAHLEKFAAPREEEVERVAPDRAKLGKAFKAQAGVVVDALKAMPPELLREPGGAERTLEGLDASARVEPDGAVALRVQGVRYRVAPDMVRVERVREKVAGEYVVPHVIEPSYGVDRILYSVLEACYRPPDAERKWAMLDLPLSLAPVQVGVFPLMPKDRLDSSAQGLEEDLRRSGLAAWYDDSGSIGKRYARMDEVGTPFCATVDYQTLQDQTVTLRARDTGAQKRVERRHLLETLQSLLAGKRRFADLPFPDVQAPPGEP
jgi:glycyl-tRNA synthetase